MRPTPIRSHIKRWLLLTPIVAQCGCGAIFGSGPCGSDTTPIINDVSVADARNALSRQMRFVDGGDPLPDGGGIYDDGGNLPEVMTAANCNEFCTRSLGNGRISCTVKPADGGEIIAVCSRERTCTGRRPAGLALGSVARAPSAVGAYLVDMARLEAASVPAFERLGRELRAHGAPVKLVRAAARAARDEVRHARVMARLAIEAGGLPDLPHVAEVENRDLEAILVENHVEGCIRETFGAVVGSHQALHAHAPRMRRIMAGIARDEITHAELSWEVARWGEQRLSKAARRRIAQQALLALAALEGDLRHEPEAETRVAMGLPDAATALSLFRQVKVDLWNAEAA